MGDETAGKGPAKITQWRRRRSVPPLQGSKNRLAKGRLTSDRFTWFQQTPCGLDRPGRPANCFARPCRRPRRLVPLFRDGQPGFPSPVPFSAETAYARYSSAVRPFPSNWRRTACSRRRLLCSLRFPDLPTMSFDNTSSRKLRHRSQQSVRYEAEILQPPDVSSARQPKPRFEGRSRMELSAVHSVWSSHKRWNRGPTVRGIPRRPETFSLRDLLPSGARRFAVNRRRSWRLFWAPRYDCTAASPVSTLPNGRGFEDHVLDHCKLESLRLVPGEIYVDR